MTGLGKLLTLKTKSGSHKFVTLITSEKETDTMEFLKTETEGKVEMDWIIYSQFWEKILNFLHWKCIPNLAFNMW